MSLRLSPINRYALVALFVSLIITMPAFAATTIHVPADQPTIQAGINAAVNGDTVLVSPGTYNENVNFNGKAITVTSASGPNTTIIDGGQKGAVVTFNTGEPRTALLSGFTIRNGNNTYYYGSGISFSNSSPTILNNLVTSNCPSGAIGGYGGNPLIQGNIITGTHARAEEQRSPVIREPCKLLVTRSLVMTQAFP
jgi:hypothetical protein